MSYDAYVKKVNETSTNYPDWRYGQCCFNVLWEMYPHLAEEIRGGSLDPFYFKVPSYSFWEFVSERLRNVE